MRLVEPLQLLGRQDRREHAVDLVARQPVGGHAGDVERAHVAVHADHDRGAPAET